MTRLVEDLLFLARTDSDAGARYRTTFDLQIPVQAAALEMMPKAAAKNVRIDVEVPDEVIHLSGDEDAIRRLVLVLIDNAMKYSPNDEIVSVALTLDGSRATLAVRDTGAGIPAASLPFIFERFYRADLSRHASSPGYGLGLSIAHVVAVQHCASINVASKPGSTEFSVSFPVLPAEQRVSVAAYREA